MTVSSLSGGRNRWADHQVATLLSPGYPLDYCPEMECHTTVSFATPHPVRFEYSAWAVQIFFNEFGLDDTTWLDVGVLRRAETSNGSTLFR